jgi:transposase-like protein
MHKASPATQVHYQRSSDRLDYTNGYQPKRVKTRIGGSDLAVPQTRKSDFYPLLRKRLRTSNRIERLNQSVKQRTKVAKIFANEDSGLRLVTAVVMEISEQWQRSKAYLSLDSNDEFLNRSIEVDLIE